MVIDSSALVAAVLLEPEAGRFGEAMRRARRRYIGAPTFVEATAVLLRRAGEDAVDTLRDLVADADITVVEMSPRAAEIACDAYRRYGKGVGKPGMLNFGDCLSYGIARAMREPLLFKGDDFAATDVEAASY